MRVNEIVKLLSMSGVDSKHQVINMLNTDNVSEILDLIDSLYERIHEIKGIK